ncbi:hypothetical protein SDC9_143255 [bioreactor metagenome]|uniref:ABC-2 type transporter domain-containing protein n=1 Tax=bioreactor metagenome TaxID=1076179 RepID=A0A645E3X3_9ZZZZ
MLESPKLIQLLSPMRYFTAHDILASLFSWTHLLIALLVSALAMQFAFVNFRKKDLSAV